MQKERCLYILEYRQEKYEEYIKLKNKYILTDNEKEELECIIKTLTLLSWY